MNRNIIQSFVWCGDNRYFVSTCDRESSADAKYGAVYAETIVWEWPQDSSRGEIIEMDEGVQGSAKVHYAMCERIRNGEFE